MEIADKYLVVALYRVSIGYFTVIKSTCTFNYLPKILKKPTILPCMCKAKPTKVMHNLSHVLSRACQEEKEWKLLQT